jgi:YfiH family protein
VGAVCSTRAGGVSEGAYASLNLGLAVGDDPAAVAENRRRFAALAGRPVVWLRQVHGTRVLQATAADAAPGAPVHEADAAWTAEPGLALAIQVADCMPVLLALPDGSAVAAAHAGWRGLAAGVLQDTVAAVCAGTGCAPRDLMAWIGPCIGPAAFEVGADVLRAFGQTGSTADPARFRWRPRPDGDPRWLADLPRLGRDLLHAAGVREVSGGDRCTVSEPSRFFSHRRDGRGGRFAAAVWRRRG